MDSLSFSPSLLPIISLLNRTEIANCRLVNRRFCQTINNNRRISPRKTICVFLERLVENPDIEYLLVTVRCSISKMTNVSIRIDNQSIRVLRCNDIPFLQYTYKEPIDGLSIRGIQKGLPIVLNPLCLNCYLKLFELKAFRPSVLPSYSAAMDIFRRNHSYLDIVQKHMWTHFEKIFLTCDGFYITVYPNQLEYPFDHKEGIWSYVPSIVETMSEIQELFKGWHDGLYRLCRIQINQESEIKDITPVYQKLAASLGPEAIWKSFLRYEILKFVDDPEYDDDPENTEYNPLYEAFFRRPSDDVILCMSYYFNDHILYIYDFVHSGPLDEIKFFYEQFGLNESF